MEKKDIIEQIESERPTLSNKERLSMWKEIESKLPVQQPIPSPFSIMDIFRQHFVAMAVLLIVVLGGSTTVLASNSARPGDFLYPIDRSIENMQLRLVRDEDTRDQLTKNFTEERLSELREIIAEETTSPFMNPDEHSVSKEDNERINEAIELLIMFLSESGFDESEREDILSELAIEDEEDAGKEYGEEEMDENEDEEKDKHEKVEEEEEERGSDFIFVPSPITKPGFDTRMKEIEDDDTESPRDDEERSEGTDHEDENYESDIDQEEEESEEESSGSEKSGSGEESGSGSDGEEEADEIADEEGAGNSENSESGDESGSGSEPEEEEEPEPEEEEESEPEEEEEPEPEEEEEPEPEEEEL